MTDEGYVRPEMLASTDWLAEHIDGPQHSCRGLVTSSSRISGRTSRTPWASESTTTSSTPAMPQHLSTTRWSPSLT